jgi:hypothetical protein
MLKPLLLVSLAALSLVSSAQAHTPPFKGNDTGGIIAWEPGIHRVALPIAAGHCARYGKYARITSVHARYGDYVGFVCRWPRGYDPMRPVLIRLY